MAELWTGYAWPTIIIVLQIVAIIIPLMVGIAYLTYAERKVLAAMQLRQGPNIVGPFGLLQPMADGLKLQRLGVRRRIDALAPCRGQRADAAREGVANRRELGCDRGCHTRATGEHDARPCKRGGRPDQNADHGARVLTPAPGSVRFACPCPTTPRRYCATWPPRRWPWSTCPTHRCSPTRA